MSAKMRFTIGNNNHHPLWSVSCILLTPALITAHKAATEPRIHNASNSNIRIASAGFGIVLSGVPIRSITAVVPLIKIILRNQIVQYSERRARPEKREYRLQKEAGFAVDVSGSGSVVTS